MKGNIMGNVIGKVLATEKNPSTMEEFYFWTKPELILNPFDVVKVEHTGKCYFWCSRRNFTYY